MRPLTLVARGFLYYWRTNLAVILGVAAAVAVLTGALMVGDSVRGSLRNLVLQRLGNTSVAVIAPGFVRERLGAEIAITDDFPAAFRDIVPLIVSDGVARIQSGDGSAAKVNVYGVDDRFWMFHGIDMTGPAERDALLSPALAEELGAQVEDTVLLRLQLPSDIPLESLHGRKDDPGRSVRARVRGVLPAESLGEFSLQAQQGDVRAIFVPLALLQEELEVPDRVNLLLASEASPPPADPAGALANLMRSALRLEDLGLSVQTLFRSRTEQTLSLEAEAGVIEDSVVDAVRAAGKELGMTARPVLTYLANTMTVRGHEVPYSLVTAMDIPELAETTGVSNPIVLNEWAALDMQARPGDTLEMEYFYWEEPGRLVTRTAAFTVTGVVPVNGADRDLAPSYPGITDSSTLSDWDPPFPINLRKVRREDEKYWEAFRTTPKAFIPLVAGQQLWGTRYGKVTSVRFPVPGPAIRGVPAAIPPLGDRLREKIDPVAAGRFQLAAVRAEGLQASEGATNFGEYFVYFSFFLVVSALLLAGLFFKLSVEQRIREVGLLRAVGLSPGLVRRLFMTEGLLLATIGTVAGVAGGILYARLIVLALRSWWIGAVGTTSLEFHLSWPTLAAGAAGGILAALVCIAMTLRGLGRISERSLLAGQLDAARAGMRRQGWKGAFVFGLLGVALVVAGAGGFIEASGAFFGAGAALLAGSLLWVLLRLRQPDSRAIAGHGWGAVARLGFRNAAYRPVRSVVAMAMIASATFILIAVDAFRKDTAGGAGLGGYSLVVETVVPIIELPEIQALTVAPFRLRPGDDASCLNLYAPKSPRILAPQDAFIDAGRFAFKSNLGETEAERENPWLLLRRQEADGAIPVIADANSMTYVLHRKLGEEIVIESGGTEVRLRLVAALEDSIFQRELLMSEENFLRLFPEQEGFRTLLVDTAAGEEETLAAELESALEDYGADAVLTGDRLAQFHQVENTYLSTFQMLGGLGLLLGTVGLGAVLLRNVLERRRDLSLLRAVGYGDADVFAMTVAENVALLVGGLVLGVLCAAIAIAPAVIDRGGRLPGGFLVGLLGAVLLSGLVTSLLATAAALRGNVVSGLKSE